LPLPTPKTFLPTTFETIAHSIPKTFHSFESLILIFAFAQDLPTTFETILHAIPKTPKTFRLPSPLPMPKTFLPTTFETIAHVIAAIYKTSRLSRVGYPPTLLSRLSKYFPDLPRRHFQDF
jgi:hypothetical protein